MIEWLKWWCGRALNMLGAPGFIQARACHSRLGVPVEIRVTELFTVVVVRNLHLMFNRLSGTFDGIVVAPEDCATPHGSNSTSTTASER